MAQTKTAPVAPAAASGVAGYTFEKFDLPVAARGGAAKTGEPNKITLALAALPIGLSFLEPVNVTVPDTITDPAERQKAEAEGFKAEARKVTNRISGRIKNYRKANPKQNFALRTVNDEKLGKGVRVFRTDDTPDAPPAPASTAPAGAPPAPTG